MSIADSGERREFSTGAVRDIQEGKGRCDLLPLDVVSDMIKNPYPELSLCLRHIYEYMDVGDTTCLMKCIEVFIQYCYGDIYTALIEVSKHYEDGCTKYGERNWEKGIPLHCYIDSGVRHLLKYFRGDSDERHDRAFIWNMLGAIWTHNHRSEMIDLEFPNSVISSDSEECFNNVK